MPGHDQATLIAALPYARRLARAITGDRRAGDALVAKALRGLPDPAAMPDARHALYAAIAAAAPAGSEPHLLGQTERLLLLLTSVEGCTTEEAGAILGLTPAHAAELLEGARAALRAQAAADVMIIEDEAVIVMDLEAVLQGCGHRVVGVASTEAEAEEVAARTRPDLILADVNLGRGGSGPAAVERILTRQTVPVIFVTAYPEKLLSGQGIEPTWVLTKPFDPMTLAVTTFEATSGGIVRT
jgi:CheY-like chemotaxis protein